MKKLLILTIMLWSNLAMMSQDVITMEQAIGLSLENNYGIKMAKNSTQIYRNNATAGNAGLLPNIDVSASMNYADNLLQLETGEVTQQFTSNSIGIGLSYVLFDGMGSIYNLQKLKSQADGSELNQKLYVENTLIQLINLYYQVANEQENLRIAKEMLIISGERKARIESKREFGQSSQLDFLNAQVDFNNDSIAYLNTKKRFDEAKRNLSVIMGMSSNTDFSVDPKVVFEHSNSLSQFKSIAYENNTSFLISKNDINVSSLDLKITKAQFMPKLSLQSSYGYNQTSDNLALNYNNPDRNFSAGLSLNFNVFDGGRKKSQRQNAQISLENAQLSLEEEVLNLERDVENAFANYKNSITVLAAERQNLESAQMNFDQSAEYYKLGQITSTQFREAQLNLNRAQTSINTALFSAKLAEIELMRLSGMLLEDA